MGFLLVLSRKSRREKMKINTPRKTAMALLCASSVLLLQACGGGGDDSTAPATDSSGSASTSTGPANSGSVSASFQPGAKPRYQLVGVGSQSFGRLDSFTQAGNGAVTKIGSTELSGQTVVQDISGDASFAAGRWVAGTVTTTRGAETLTGNDNRSYHYVVYNGLETFPADGSVSCNAGTFTTPSRDGGPASAPQTASTSGNATLTFTSEGATVAGKLAVSAGSSSASVTLDTTKLTAGSTNITGSYLNNGAGAGIQVGDAGGGTYELVGSYRAKTSDGAGYIGVFRFACK
jgi:hypothetical protein